MARSRRKTPIFGVAGGSDKPFKEQEHRRERRATKVALATDRDPPHRLDYGDPWNAPKDGKAWCDLRKQCRDDARRPWNAK